MIYIINILCTSTENNNFLNFLNPHIWEHRNTKASHSLYISEYILWAGTPPRPRPPLIACAIMADDMPAMLGGPPRPLFLGWRLKGRAAPGAPLRLGLTAAPSGKFAGPPISPGAERRGPAAAAAAAGG